MHGAKLVQPGITFQVGVGWVAPAHGLLQSKQADKAFVNRPSETIAGKEKEDSRHVVQVDGSCQTLTWAGTGPGEPRLGQQL